MAKQSDGVLAPKDEQRARQRVAEAKYEEGHVEERREKRRLAAQRRRDRIACLPRAEQEMLQERQRKYHADYRANHRSHLRKASARCRIRAKPDALPRKGCLRKPEQYAPHQRARHDMINEYKTAQRWCMKERKGAYEEEE